MNYFNQCVLIKNKSTQVAWIPAQFAHAGNNISLKVNDIWEHGWIIQYVGVQMEAGQINECSSQAIYEI